MGIGAYNKGIQKGEGRMMAQRLMKAILAWTRAVRLVMDKEPAMSQDEARLVQAIQQDMPQLS